MIVLIKKLKTIFLKSVFLGFPSRVQYDEFAKRYIILHAEAKKDADFCDWKAQSKEICTGIKLGDEKHKFGHTKLFFKAGVIGDLEDARDEKIASILTSLQVKILQIFRQLRKKGITNMNEARAMLFGLKVI